MTERHNRVKMSKVQMLRAQVSRRLSAAVDEILQLFERTIEEYEEEFSRSQKENVRLRKLLDDGHNADVRSHGAGLSPLNTLSSKTR